MKSMKIMVEEEKLYQLVKRAVNEAWKENLKKLKLSIIPYADDKEMAEIEEIFGSPKKYRNQQFVIKKI